MNVRIAGRVRGHLSTHSFVNEKVTPLPERVNLYQVTDPGPNPAILIPKEVFSISLCASLHVSRLSGSRRTDVYCAYLPVVYSTP